MQRAVCVYLGHGIAQGWAGLGCGLSAALLPLVLPPATRTRILPIPPALPAALPPPCPTPPPCSYKEAWDSFVDAWLVVRVASPDYAYRWRLQAEQSMRASGRPAMTDEQVAAFVDRFMPAYRAYLPGLYAAGPTTAAPGRLLVVEVDERRGPLAQQPAPIM